jgi:copper transport protein
VSSDDLHSTSGTFVFGVQRQVAPGTATIPDDPLPAAGEVVTQAAIYLGLGGWMGAILLLALARPGDPDSSSLRRRLLKAAIVAAAAGFVGGIALLLLRAATLSDSPFRAAWLVLTGSSIGTPTFVRQGASLAMIGLAIFAVRRPAMPRPALFATATVLSVAAALSTALLGHLSATGPLWLGTDTLHVLATMVWAGTVIAAGTVLVTRRDLARVVLRRFGLIATAALTVLVATGLLLTGDRVASVDALLLSTYGRTLLIKIALVAVAALAGLVTTLSLHRWRRPRATTPAVRIEMALLLGVLVMTAGLVSTHQASGPLWRPVNPSDAQTSSSATVDDLVQTVSVRPNLPGRNFVAVNVFDTRRPAPAPVESVMVTLRGPTGSTVTRPASRAGLNSYLLATDDFVAGGQWEITTTAVRPQLAPASGVITWAMPPGAVVTRRPVVSQSQLTPYTGWLAGGVLVIGLTALTILARRRAGRSR